MQNVCLTSSKGNQQKWVSSDIWYKRDQFGYEALTECVAANILSKSKLPFNFVSYSIARVDMQGIPCICSKSANFLKQGEVLVTVAKLLQTYYSNISDLFKGNNKQKLQTLIERVIEITGLSAFGEYLTALSELDSLILNDDRHLNNIAVIKRGTSYDYCPIFDNGAGLLSNFQLPMDVEPKALVKTQLFCAKPFNMSFTHQRNMLQEMYGPQIYFSKFTKEGIQAILTDLLLYYPKQLQPIIQDRIIEVLLTRQKT